MTTENQAIKYDNSRSSQQFEGPFDIAVIGAGVVGCAMARQFALDGARVVVLEKSADILDGASKGNSAILHTGFDAPPGSLEQHCIAAGYEEFLRLRESLGLPVLKNGALVLAWSEEQFGQLDGLIEKAFRNKVCNVEKLTRTETHELEPSLAQDVTGGFLVPGEYIIDPWSTPLAYLTEALHHNTVLLRNYELVQADFDGEHWQLKSAEHTCKAKLVINCAGLYGDRVEEILTGRRPFTVTPRKGQFLVFDKSAARLINKTILPVPTKKTKGIVICRTIFGNLLVGPTAEDQQSKTDSSTDQSTLQYLYERAIAMLPELKQHEITACYAGLRPATQFDDYQISHYGESNHVCVGGIRSTGLSAALGIANYVAELVGQNANTDFPGNSYLNNSPSSDSHLNESSVSTVPNNTARTATPQLSEYHPRQWQQAGNNSIVCHCELVTENEIVNSLQSKIAPASLDGLKRQTRAGMGRCQGFYCHGRLSSICNEYFNNHAALKTKDNAD